MPQLTAITSQTFASKAWKSPTGYAFAAQMNAVPVVAAELGRLVPTLPMGFVATETGLQLVAITALQPDTNLLIVPDGRWIGDYIPAVLRAYPFRLAKPEGSEESILCFDESSHLLVDAGEGGPFAGPGRRSKGFRRKAATNMAEAVARSSSGRAGSWCGGRPGRQCRGKATR